jgi:hypothetical protein
MKKKYRADSVLIIGNGFDLNQNLKTSYRDFLDSEEFLNICLGASQNRLADFLASKRFINKWIDVEIELKNYSKKETLQIRLEKYGEDFKELKKTLKEYLQSINNNLTFNKNSDAYKVVKNITSEDYLIIDFNYTDTTYKIVEDIHGTLQPYGENVIKIHSDLQNDLIFGVEDAAEIDDTFYFLRKSYNKNFIGVNVNDILRDAKQILFFGYSLGETDHMYFEDFFKNISTLNSSDAGKKITFFFHGDDGYDQLHHNLFKLTGKNYRLFRTQNEVKFEDTLKN